MPPDPFHRGIHLFVRKTTDWSNEETFRSQLDPAFAPKVETWNKTFSMPYHVFRQELAAIAEWNHSALPCWKTTIWEEVPEGAIVVPTDDDDWFAPAAIECIGSNMGSRDDGCLWRQSVLEVPINFLHRVHLTARKILPFLKPKWLCSTNNYAFIKKSSSINWSNHMQASKAFSSGTLKIADIPRYLSVHNRSLASITSMGLGKNEITPREMRCKAMDYKKLYAKASLPEELSWAQPFVLRMKALMQDLKFLY
jgi:hypothetical protein